MLKKLKVRRGAQFPGHIQLYSAHIHIHIIIIFSVHYEIKVFFFAAIYICACVCTCDCATKHINETHTGCKGTLNYFISQTKLKCRCDA